jgi:hypothetical protein
MNIPIILSILGNYKFIQYSITYPKQLIQKLDKFMMSDHAIFIFVILRIYNLDHYLTYFLLLTIIAKYYYILCIIPNISNSVRYYRSLFYVLFMSILLTILF